MLYNAWKVAKPYFTGQSKYAALGMLLVIITFELLFIYINVQYNSWSNRFYNALQELSYEAFSTCIKEWLVLVTLMILVFLIKTFTNMWMQLHWRYWLTHNYLERWTEGRTFYGLKVMGYESDNPDQRISEDILSFVSYFNTLSIGLVSAAVSLITFTVILWRISGDINFTVLGHEVHVAGYMVWIALIYTLISTVMMHLIGKPLVKLLFEQEHLQANFRYGMMRLREHAEAIAFYNAAKFERFSLLERFKEVVRNTKQRIKLGLSLSIFTNIYNNISIIMPIIIVSPRYFAKEIKLGDVMQVSDAFGSLNSALSWIISSYTAIAAFQAVTWRLHTFVSSMEQWDKEQANSKVLFVQEKGPILHWQQLEVRLPMGQILLKLDAPFNSKALRYLIIGPSGSGKSTLIRVIAGIWPFAEGTIHAPNEVAFIPQNSYMPYGTLLQAIQYPQTLAPSQSQIEALLEKADLSHLIARLYDVDEWGRVLSGGEKQRIAFLRGVLQAPKMLVLDEAFSALDEENVGRMHHIIDTYLSDTLILSVSHNYDEHTNTWPRLRVEGGRVALLPALH